MRVCLIGYKNCPNCKNEIRENDNNCSSCGIEIRRINTNRVKNRDFLRKICCYDMDGNIINTYKNVYECFPYDTKDECKKRASVIKVCNGKASKFENFQWRFADDTSEVVRLEGGGASKSIVRCDFNGKVIQEFSSIGEATKQLKLTCATVSKACKKRIPPKDMEYFLFFSDEFCDYVFECAKKAVLAARSTIEVYNSEGKLLDTYDSYESVANKLGVSAVSISNWCAGKCNPSGKYKNYKFVLKGEKAKAPAIKSYCNKPEKEQCVISNMNVLLQEKVDELQNKLDISQAEERRLNSEINKKFNEKLKQRYLRRGAKYDSRINFMTPIDEFIKEKVDLSAGSVIYILCDSEGKRYVGQTNKNNYSRIKEHFDGRCQDSVYEAYKKGVAFYVERVVIGWEESQLPFNLDDTEAYFIAYYDSYHNGYNRTIGNHV